MPTMLALRTSILASILSSGLSCGDAPYVELQIADERPPFLQPNADFDALGVEASHPPCADTEVRYSAQALPATLTIVPGDCFEGSFELRAFALLDERRIAESRWLALAFPKEGPLVATATLADLPGPRVLFHTGFEPGEPVAGSESLLAVEREDIQDLVASVDRSIAVEGTSSIVIRGAATSPRAHVLVRAVAMDLVVAPGDRLTYQVWIERGTAPPTLGVELELDTGATARSLSLRDESGALVHPATAEGRRINSWQRVVVDLTIAARSRLVGVLFGFDAREVGGTGSFSAHFDDLTIDAP